MPERMLRDWTDSEAVNQLDWAAECLFTRLIMKADDFGRFHGNPRLIKSLLFPLKDGLRDADISRWIAECVKAGLLREYTDRVSGKPFIEIRKYGQRLRTKKAKFPDENGRFAAPCGNPPQNAAECGEAPPEVEVEGEGEVEGENPARGAGTHTHEENRWYPKTVDEVMAIAADPRCAVEITREQAEEYFLTRDTAEWVDAARRKIQPGKVYNDLKRWVLRARKDPNYEQPAEAEARQLRRQYEEIRRRNENQE